MAASRDIMTIVSTLLILVACYLGTGVVFAIAFVIAGVQRMDHAAVGSGIRFRIILVPGAAALWPLLLQRWMMAGRLV
jgi:hypothetical protein